jgi:hypothetical protein
VAVIVMHIYRNHWKNSTFRKEKKKKKVIAKKERKVHLLGLGCVGWFVLIISSNEEGRGKFAVRRGERRQSFGDLEAHFRALRCVSVCVSVFSYLF